MYGYEIVKMLRSQFEGVWEPKTGTVYPALRSLESKRFVKTEIKDEKEYYSLTQEGETMLKAMDDVLGEGVERTGRYYSFIEGFPEMRKFWEKFVFEPTKYWMPRFKEYERELELKSLRGIRGALKRRLEGIDERIAVLERVEPPKDQG